MSNNLLNLMISVREHFLLCLGVPVTNTNLQRWVISPRYTMCSLIENFEYPGNKFVVMLLTSKYSWRINYWSTTLIFKWWLSLIENLIKNCNHPWKLSCDKSNGSINLDIFKQDFNFVSDRIQILRHCCLQFWGLQRLDHSWIHIFRVQIGSILN